MGGPASLAFLSAVLWGYIAGIGLGWLDAPGIVTSYIALFLCGANVIRALHHFGL